MVGFFHLKKQHLWQLMQKLEKAAKLRGHFSWARGLDTVRHYNSKRHETRFQTKRGYYDSYYIPAVYWWYKTTSHAIELIAGYFSPSNQDGHSWLFEVLKKHMVTIKFVISGLQASYQEIDEATSDPERLNWC